VILVNASGASLPKTSERALELLARLQPEMPASTTPIAMDAAEMTKYAGSYANPPQRLDLVLRDGRLYFRRGEQEGEVVKIGDLRFSVTAAGAAPAQTFALVPGHDGAIAFLHMGSRAFKKAATKAS
jgi:hypothetical protein